MVTPSLVMSGLPNYDGVPFADLLPEERINAAAYYVEEHLEDWTTLLSFTVPYARYTDVPNAK